MKTYQICAILLSLMLSMNSAIETSDILREDSTTYNEFFKYIADIYDQAFLERRELDSTWSKILYGAQRSGVRYQLRMGQSCISDGEQLLAGVLGVFYRYVTGRFSEDDYYNLNDVFLSFNTKCNIIDTI